jgi:hypothetical protein
MSELKCEQCGRPIKGEPVKKTLKGKEHILCSDHCFWLYFYKIPFTYEDIYKYYRYYCATTKALNWKELAEDERLTG